MKSCGRCGAEFEPHHFNVVYCSEECRRLRLRESWRDYRGRNLESARRVARDWRVKNPDRVVVASLKRYGLTVDQFNGLIEEQGGRCGICPATEPGGKGRWHIDHDHSCCPEQVRSCGKCVRGLLCRRCNMALGGFNDDPSLLARALAYVGGAP